MPSISLGFNVKLHEVCPPTSLCHCELGIVNGRFAHALVFLRVAGHPSLSCRCCFLGQPVYRSDSWPSVLVCHLAARPAGSAAESSVVVRLVFGAGRNVVLPTGHGWRHGDWFAPFGARRSKPLVGAADT